MKREIKSYAGLLGKVTGLSDDLLKAHFGLYEGYVKKLNEIEEKLEKGDPTLSNYSYGEYSELKRRFTVAYNGAYLHEMYFENMPAAGTPGALFAELVNKTFGSMEKWKADVKGTGIAVAGWVVTALDTVTGKLQNLQLSEHHVGYPVNQIPLLVMDTWEHAFAIDYKTDRGGYIEVFMKNINWDVVNKRTEKAIAAQK